MSLKRIAVASLLAASLMIVGSAPAEPKDACTWGASSVVAEKVGDQYVQSEPATTGCIPTTP